MFTWHGTYMSMFIRGRQPLWILGSSSGLFFWITQGIQSQTQYTVWTRSMPYKVFAEFLDKWGLIYMYIWRIPTAKCFIKTQIQTLYIRSFSPFSLRMDFFSYFMYSENYEIKHVKILRYVHFNKTKKCRSSCLIFFDGHLKCQC